MNKGNAIAIVIVVAAIAVSAYLFLSRSNTAGINSTDNSSTTIIQPNNSTKQNISGNVPAGNESTPQIKDNHSAEFYAWNSSLSNCVAQHCNADENCTIGSISVIGKVYARLWCESYSTGFNPENATDSCLEKSRAHVWNFTSEVC